jgi:hypothetical protein
MNKRRRWQVKTRRRRNRKNSEYLQLPRVQKIWKHALNYGMNAAKLAVLLFASSDPERLA